MQYTDFTIATSQVGTDATRPLKKEVRKNKRRDVPRHVERERAGGRQMSSLEQQVTT